MREKRVLAKVIGEWGAGEAFQMRSGGGSEKWREMGGTHPPRFFRREKRVLAKVIGEWGAGGAFQMRKQGRRQEED